MVEIFVDLDPETAEALEKVAQQHHCTPSEYVRDFLIQYVENYKKEPQSE